MAITPLPTPPSRSQSPATFSTDADAFLGALPAFASEANALATDVNADEASAAASATTASNAASVAVGAANYQGDYNAGTTYQIGESVSYSGRRYVAKTINTGVTPADGANWFLINDGDVLGPVSATNNALALYDGTTGKIIKSGLNNGTAGQALISGGSGNAPAWQSLAQAGQRSATAASNITLGQPVALRADGQIEPVSGSVVQGFLGATAASPETNQHTNTQMYDCPGVGPVMLYRDGSTTFGIRVGTIVPGTQSITFGAETQISSFPSNSYRAAWDSITNRLLIVTSNDVSQWSCFVVTFSGGVATVGTSQNLSDTGSVQNWDVAFNSTTGDFTLVYDVNSVSLYLRRLTVSGLAVTYGTRRQIVGAAGDIGTGELTQKKLTWNPARGVFVLCHVGNWRYRFAVISQSGDNYTLGGTVAGPSSGFDGTAIHAAYNSDDQEIVAIVGNDSDTQRPLIPFRLIQSGTTISAVQGAAIAGSSNSNNGIQSFRTVLAYSPNDRKFALIFRGRYNWSSIAFFQFNATAQINEMPLTVTPESFTAVNHQFIAYDSASQAIAGVTIGGSSSDYRIFCARGGRVTTNADRLDGVALANITSGQIGAYAISGTQVAGQTSLVAGSVYYITLSGGLSRYPTGYKKVGRAVSATEILVEDVEVSGFAGSSSMPNVAKRWEPIGKASSPYSLTYSTGETGPMTVASPESAADGSYFNSSFQIVSGTAHIFNSAANWSTYYSAWFTTETRGTNRWISMSRDGINWNQLVLLPDSSSFPQVAGSLRQPNVAVDDSNGNLWIVASGSFPSQVKTAALCYQAWNFPNNPITVDIDTSTFLSSPVTAALRYCNTGNTATSRMVLVLRANTSLGIYALTPGTNTWTFLTSGSSIASSTGTRLVFEQSSGRGMIVPQSQSGTANIWTCDGNAGTWTARSVTQGTNASAACAVGNGTFALVGTSSNRMVYSTNGSTWTLGTWPENGAFGPPDELHWMAGAWRGWRAGDGANMFGSKCFSTRQTLPTTGWVLEQNAPRIVAGQAMVLRTEL